MTTLDTFFDEVREESTSLTQNQLEESIRKLKKYANGEETLSREMRFPNVMYAVRTQMLMALQSGDTLDEDDRKLNEIFGYVIFSLKIVGESMRNALAKDDKEHFRSTKNEAYTTLKLTQLTLIPPEYLEIIEQIREDHPRVSEMYDMINTILTILGNNDIDHKVKFEQIIEILHDRRILHFGFVSAQRNSDPNDRDIYIRGEL